MDIIFNCAGNETRLLHCDHDLVQTFFSCNNAAQFVAVTCSEGKIRRDIVPKPIPS